MGPRPAGIVHGIFSRSKPSLVQGPFMFAPPQPLGEFPGAGRNSRQECVRRWLDTSKPTTHPGQVSIKARLTDAHHQPRTLAAFRAPPPAPELGRLA
jgi:hypothetical protein